MLGGTQWPVVLNPSAEPQEEGRSSIELFKPFHYCQKYGKVRNQVE